MALRQRPCLRLEDHLLKDTGIQGRPLHIGVETMTAAYEAVYDDVASAS